MLIDTRIVASTAQNAANTAANVPDGHTTAVSRGRRTDVRVVPVSGMPVDQARVQDAVRDRLGQLDERFSKHVRVHVEENGTLS